jgi:hypothetical protein
VGGLLPSARRTHRRCEAVELKTDRSKAITITTRWRALHDQLQYRFAVDSRSVEIVLLTELIKQVNAFVLHVKFI